MTTTTTLPREAATHRPGARAGQTWNKADGTALHRAALASGGAPRDLAAAIAGRFLTADDTDAQEEPTGHAVSIAPGAAREAA